jgi:tetratricopeptide (TPR) repeat protein
MKKEGYPSFGDDKILDALPDIRSERKPNPERYARPRPQAPQPVRKKRGLGIIQLLLTFMLGIGAGWFLVGKGIDHGKEIGKWFAYPLAGIRLVKNDGEGRGPTSIVLQPGETIRANYLRGAVRYVSLERRSTPLAAVNAILVAPPVLYLDGRPIEPGDNLLAGLKPEESLSYDLQLRPAGKEKVLASFHLELKIGPQGWLARAAALEDPHAKKTCLENALKEDPDNADVLMALGHLLWTQNQTDAAVEQFQKLLEYHPNNITALTALASIYWKKEPKKALEIYKTLAEIDHEGRVSHYKQIARLQERLGLSAVDTYRNILFLSKDDPEAQEGLKNLYAGDLERARELEKKGDYPKAIEEAKRALEIQSTSEGREYLAALHNNYAFALAKDGRYNQAVEQYNASLELDKSPTTYLNLADAYAKADRVDRSLQALEQADKLGPTDPQLRRSILLLWSDLYISQEEYGKAIPKFKQLLAQEPKDVDILRALGMAYWKNGEKEKAVTTLQKLPPLMKTASNKERAEIFRLIGDLHRSIAEGQQDLQARLSRYDQALAAYKQAGELKDKAAQQSWEEVAAKRKELKIKILESS